ncbi:hypothetical protein K431DRAFT_280469 [Polychaeton citri CBS 116435]|uniref:Phosphatidylglycerol/phosphatidylinositol transfer protein n=1 Tax=Polychaeton citri CBS 116435 TaxID=1314669 RepID=A0A9P4QHP2_9PEZI|nr:hypothetical protein K431DRAFT_280469 [Polychaeton citri CBS 116435]
MRFPITAALVGLVTSSTALSFFQGNQISVLEEGLDIPGENPLKHCENPEHDILDLKKVDLDPNPPAAGKTLKITASGYLSEDVEDGATVHLQVKYGLITIIRQNADLCETVKNVDLECPIKKGDITLTKEVDLPKEIPPGKYTVLADVFTKDEEKITCLTATVEFKRGGNALLKESL